MKRKTVQTKYDIPVRRAFRLHRFSFIYAVNDLWEDAYTCPIYAMKRTTGSAIYVMELWLQNGESKGIEMLNANSVTSELTYFIQILHPLLSYENLYY